VKDVESAPLPPLYLLLTHLLILPRTILFPEGS
jgi:hypothetical protein